MFGWGGCRAMLPFVALNAFCFGPISWHVFIMFRHVLVLFWNALGLFLVILVLWGLVVIAMV